jgi:small subunit ribosomal protein S23
MFQPLNIPYQEDRLRKDFFGDHPWELARPKVVLEDGGDERKGWDWSKGIRQPGKRIDGERFVSAYHSLFKILIWATVSCNDSST